MKTQAYICDCCNGLFDVETVSGLSQVKDLYDFVKSYPVIMDAEKASIHFCIECYNKAVTIPVSMITDRAKDEENYIKVFQEYSYSFRQSTVFKHFKRDKK